MFVLCFDKVIFVFAPFAQLLPNYCPTCPSISCQILEPEVPIFANMANLFTKSVKSFVAVRLETEFNI